MSKTRRSTSSPKRKPSSPKRKQPSRSSKLPENPPRRGILTGRVFAALGIATGILALVGSIVWFASAGWRADQAQAYDQASRALLQRHDIDGSYQQARLAYAISPESDRALSLGSLAYVRGDFRQALEYFSSAVGPFGTLGRAAAGAQVDPDAYETARNELREPADTVVRLGLSHAAVDANDFGTAGRLGEGARTIVGAYPYLIAESVEDPDAAAKTLRALQPGSPRIIHPDPAVAAFLNELTAVPEAARTDIAAALRNMDITKGDFSRRMMRGGLLFALDEHAAALRIGKTASEQKPDYRDAWNLRAAADLAFANYDDAQRALTISTDLDPGFGYSWYLRSELEKATGNQSKADEYLRRAELLGFKKLP